MVTAVRELHTQCERTMPSLEKPSAPPLQFTSDQVIQAVKSFQAGTAPRPSGLRAQHLKDLTSSRNMAPHIAANVTKALTKVVNLFASGKAASGAAEYCAGANLFAANNKDGGIRPIAVGDVMNVWSQNVLLTPFLIRQLNYLPHCSSVQASEATVRP